MDPRIPVLAGIAIALLVTVLWAGTVVYVCWDVYRSALAARQQIRWAALSLVPFVGFVSYLVQRRQWIVSDEPPGPETILSPEGSWRPTASASANVRPQASEEGHPIAVADLPSFCLYAATGPHRGREFAVPSLPALIGRDTTATILLDEDANVSRRHAELYEREGELWLRDLGSTHCTLVNDCLIADQVLVLGDTVGVGQSLLLLREKTGDGT